MASEPVPRRQDTSRERHAAVPHQLSFAFPSPGHTLAGSPTGDLRDAVDRLIARTCAAQGLPLTVEDPAVLRQVAGILASQEGTWV